MKKAFVILFVGLILVIAGCVNQDNKDPDQPKGYVEPPDFRISDNLSKNKTKSNLDFSPLNTTYSAGEPIQAKIKNNEQKPLYIMSKNSCGGSFFSVYDANGNELVLTDPTAPVLLICEFPLIQLIEPGNESMLDLWNGRYFDKSFGGYVDASPGNYTIVLDKVVLYDYPTIAQNSSDTDLNRGFYNNLYKLPEKDFEKLEVKVVITEQ